MPTKNNTFTSLTTGILGQIFSGIHVSDQQLFNENVIVDLSRVGSSETKAMIMGMLILKLNEFRMSEKKPMNSLLAHVTVLEEAHNLLKRTSTSQQQESSNLIGKSVEMISNSIAEMRTDGEENVIVQIRYTSPQGDGVYGFEYSLADYENPELIQHGENVTIDSLLEQ